MSREDGEAAVRVSLPEGTTATVGVREGMTVEEFLAAACARRSLNALEHFVRVKKRRDMEDHNYFVPHRSDLIETYVSYIYICFFLCIYCFNCLSVINSRIIISFLITSFKVT